GVPTGALPVSGLRSLKPAADHPAESAPPAAVPKRDPGLLPAREFHPTSPLPHHPAEGRAKDAAAGCQASSITNACRCRCNYRRAPGNPRFRPAARQESEPVVSPTPEPPALAAEQATPPDFQVSIPTPTAVRAWICPRRVRPPAATCPLQALSEKRHGMNSGVTQAAQAHLILFFSHHINKSSVAFFG